MDAPDDDDLIARARGGDRDAIEALLAGHQAQVYRFGLAMCRDPEDAKDVLQETMLAVARTIRDFRGASSFSTWLFTIARSFCIKKRRRRVDTSAALEDEELQGRARPPDEEAEGRELERALDRAIAGLDPAHREVLVLRDVEGLSAPEVAGVLGVGVQAVKSRLHRARRAIRDELAPIVEPDAAPRSGCPDVLTMFSRSLEDELSAETCREMERHLAGCPRCRGTCDSLKRTLALCRSSAHTMEVPAPVQARVKVALRDFLAKKP